MPELENRELECASCLRQFKKNERRYQIIHTGNMFYEVLDVCRECKITDLLEEFKNMKIVGITIEFNPEDKKR